MRFFAIIQEVDRLMKEAAATWDRYTECEAHTEQSIGGFLAHVEYLKKQLSSQGSAPTESKQ